MKLKHIKAVLFDIDGTLLDSTELIFRCYEYTIAVHKLSSKTREEISVIFGKPLEECYRILFPDEEIKDLSETHLSFQEKNLHLIKLFYRVKETLVSLKNKGIKVAAVTTRSKRTSTKSLELTDIAKYFHIVVSREDVVNPKPHAEPLLKAIRFLSIDSRSAVMVGDTRIDIEAGKSAGIKTIGVLYGMHSKGVVDASPDYVIQDISELLPILL